MFEFKNQEAEQKNSLDNSLGQILNSEDFQKIKDFFGRNFEAVADIKIEIDNSQENDNYDPKFNKIFLKEKNAPIDIVIHELHHALIENKYQISQIENEIYNRFNIRESDIVEIAKIVNEEFSEEFLEALDKHNKIGKDLILNDTEQKLINHGKDRKEVAFMMDFFKTKDLLKALESYRNFFSFYIEQKFGKEAAETLKVLSDIQGDNEIIGRAIEEGDEVFGLDIISYKFHNIKNGSFDIYKTKQSIKKCGYDNVLENQVGKKIKHLKSKMLSFKQ